MNMLYTRHQGKKVSLFERRPVFNSIPDSSSPQQSRTNEGIPEYFPLTGKLLEGTQGLRQSPKLLAVPTTLAADTAYGLSKWAAGTAIPSLGGAIKNRVERGAGSAMKTIGWGSGKAANFGIVSPIKIAAAPIGAASLDAAIGAAHSAVHIPHDALRLASAPLNIVAATGKGVASALSGIAGIFGWKKAQQASANLASSARNSLGEAFTGYYAGNAAGMMIDSVFKSGIYSGKNSLKAWTDLFGMKKASESIDKGAATLAHPNIIKRILGTRQDLQENSLGDHFFKEATLAA